MGLALPGEGGDISEGITHASLEGCLGVWSRNPHLEVCKRKRVFEHMLFSMRRAIGVSEVEHQATALIPEGTAAALSWGIVTGAALKGSERRPSGKACENRRWTQCFLLLFS